MKIDFSQPLGHILESSYETKCPKCGRKIKKGNESIYVVDKFSGTTYCITCGLILTNGNVTFGSDKEWFLALELYHLYHRRKNEKDAEVPM